MATTSTKLKMSYTTNEGKTASKSLNLAKGADDIEASDVKALMDAMITNTEVFKTTLVSKSGAQVIQTSTTDINIDD